MKSPFLERWHSKIAGTPHIWQIGLEWQEENYIPCWKAILSLLNSHPRCKPRNLTWCSLSSGHWSTSTRGSSQQKPQQATSWRSHGTKPVTANTLSSIYENEVQLEGGEPPWNGYTEKIVQECICVSYFVLCRAEKEKKGIFLLASRGKTSILIDSGQVCCYHL